MSTTSLPDPAIVWPAGHGQYAQRPQIVATAFATGCAVAAAMRAADKRGKHDGPQEKVVYLDAAKRGPYVRAKVPVAWCWTDRESYDGREVMEPTDGQAARIQKYQAMTTSPPPVLLRFAGRLDDQRPRLRVDDGNHRVSAARARGQARIEAFMTCDDYRKMRQ